MARPYSTDLRDRVVASVTGGRTCRATAALFGVSVASVVKWSQRFRATGSAAAYWMGGHRPRVLAGERDWLLARLTEAYISLGILDEAQTAAAVLGHNFPDSPWYKDAYKLLKSAGGEPAENKGSWMSRAFKGLG